MPEKIMWKVDISISGNIISNQEVFAEDAESAEDAISELITLSAKKAYKKGQENEQETEGATVDNAATAL